MSRTRKDSTLINERNRCDICATQLTLYPKSFAPCPSCQKKVCRRCWDGAWAEKAFLTEKCNHLLANEGQTLHSVEGGARFQWDWQRAVFALVLVALTAGVLYFFLNLFVL